MSKKSLVSIIVNCHNGERYLENCLKSIFSQHSNELLQWREILKKKYCKHNSTLINIMLGLLKPDSENVLVNRKKW